MVDKKSTVTLTISRDEANQKISERIKIGDLLLSASINSEDSLSAEKDKYHTWNDYNIELLSRIFSNDDFSEEYSGSGFSIWSSTQTFRDDVNDYKNDVKTKIRRLSSIIERLELIPELHQDKMQKTNLNNLNNKVFIVHGHDEVFKVKVARFIEKLKLEAVILHEQINKGNTVIEKFEKYASQVSFAIILLTPDDIGYPKDKEELKNYRARQNVVLEMGYFTGLLGRDKVCVLIKGDVEIPSDYLGVVYTQLDDAGAWQLLLAKEMKESGMNIDLNKVM